MKSVRRPGEGVPASAAGHPAPCGEAEAGEDGVGRAGAEGLDRGDTRGSQCPAWLETGTESTRCSYEGLDRRDVLNLRNIILPLRPCQQPLLSAVFRQRRGCELQRCSGGFSLAVFRHPLCQQSRDDDSTAEQGQE